MARHDGSFENPVSVFIDTGPGAPVAAAGQPPVLTSFGMWGSKPTDSREGNCGWDGWVTRSYDGGRTFRDLTKVLTADPHCKGGTRYDTQPGLFFDGGLQRYIGTARASRDPSCGFWYPKTTGKCAPPLEEGTCNCSEPGAQRSIAMTQSASASLTDGQQWDSHRSSVGSKDHQYYTGVTFPWLGVYLQMTMVYDASSSVTEQRVHCRLQYSTDLERWHMVEPASDFIPLGAAGAYDSHIIFAASGVHSSPEGEHVYYFEGDGPHYGPRNSSFALARFRPSGLVGVGLLGGSTTGTLVTAPLTAAGPRLLLTADVAAGSVLVASRSYGHRSCSQTVSVLAGAHTHADVPFVGDFVPGESFVLSFGVEGAQTLLYTLSYRGAQGRGPTSPSAGLKKKRVFFCSLVKN